MEEIMIFKKFGDKGKICATYHMDTTRGSRIRSPTSRILLEIGRNMKTLGLEALQPEMPPSKVKPTQPKLEIT